MNRIRIQSAAISADRELGAIYVEDIGHVLKNRQLLVAGDRLTRERIASNRRLVALETEQVRRMSDRQRPQQQRVDAAEDGSIRADSQSQRDDGCAGEFRGAEQHGQAISQVLPQLPHDSYSPEVAALFLAALNAIKRQHGFTARFSGCHTRGDVLRGFALDLIAKLVIPYGPKNGSD
jgi:hypothetical protein